MEQDSSSSSPPPPSSPKHFSRLLGQLVKALSFNNSSSSPITNNKTDFCETPPSIHQAEEALEQSGSKDAFPEVGLREKDSSSCRLLVYRCTESKDKILFDSDYVTDEGCYLPQKDSKFLKETVMEFVFGAISLAKVETVKFTKLTERQSAFAVVFNLRTTTTSTNPSPMRRPFHTSSSDSSSSSGYSSLPLLDDSGDYSSSSLHPSHSLPATPIHLLSTSPKYPMMRCRSRCPSRLTLGAVILFSNDIPPSLLEPLLPHLQTYISQVYLKSPHSKFPTLLKSYYNCLQQDLLLYNHHHQPTNLPHHQTDIFPLFNLKIFSEFISLLLTNQNSKIVVVTSSKLSNTALSIFKVCYLIRHFNFPHHHHHQEKFTLTTPAVDSGFFSCTTIKSDEEEEEEDEELICDVDDKPKNNKFYLGDEEDDEQTESKLALSEPMKEKLFPHHQTPFKSVVNVQDVDLDLSPVSRKKEPEETYHLNTTTRFSPFQPYQLHHTQPSYDYIHTVTNEILEVNVEKLHLRSINLKEQPSPEQREAIRTLVSKTRNMFKLIKDTEKSLFFFLVNLVEIL